LKVCRRHTSWLHRICSYLW